MASFSIQWRTSTKKDLRKLPSREVQALLLHTERPRPRPAGARRLEIMPKIADLIVGVSFFVSGLLMLWQLPRYQRRVEAGGNKRDPSRPSFKTLRFAAFGFLFLGVLFIAGWY